MLDWVCGDNERISNGLKANGHAIRNITRYLRSYIASRNRVASVWTRICNGRTNYIAIDLPEPHLCSIRFHVPVLWSQPFCCCHGTIL